MAIEVADADRISNRRLGDFEAFAALPSPEGFAKLFSTRGFATKSQVGGSPSQWRSSSMAWCGQGICSSH
jgi:hypothetical protein